VEKQLNLSYDQCWRRVRSTLCIVIEMASLPRVRRAAAGAEATTCRAESDRAQCIVVPVTAGDGAAAHKRAIGHEDGTRGQKGRGQIGDEQARRGLIGIDICPEPIRLGLENILVMVLDQLGAEVGRSMQRV